MSDLTTPAHGHRTNLSSTGLLRGMVLWLCLGLTALACRSAGGQDLIALAGDEKVPTQQRLEAIAQLGLKRDRRAAGVLVRLLQDEQGDPIRSAAAAALINMTGLGSFGDDPARWRQWYEQTRGLSDREWLDDLLDRLQVEHRLTTERYTALRSELDVTRQQLVSLQTQAYRATAPQERPNFLIALLTSPLESSRELGMTLADQRLTEAGPFDEPLRAALRKVLTDPSASLRARSALLLRHLADESAADLVAAQLAAQTQTADQVNQAYLHLLTRLPRAKAVPPAIALLDQASTCAPAAGFLTAAARRDLLDRTQLDHTADLARNMLDHADPPVPALILLLAQVGGQDNDWQRIAGYLKHDNEQVRQAAAQAWAVSNQPLAPLAEVATTSVLRQIVLAAVIERGHDARTFLTIMAYRGEPEAIRLAWHNALVAMAGRVDPQVLVQALEMDIQQPPSLDVRRQMLDAAIDNLTRGEQLSGSTSNGLTPEEASDLIDLLLARCGVVLAGDEHAEARRDLDRIVEMKLTLNKRQTAVRDLLLAKLSAESAEAPSDTSAETPPDKTPPSEPKPKPDAAPDAPASDPAAPDA